MAPRTAWGTAPRALNTPTMEPPSRRETAGCNDTDLPAVRRTLGRSDRFHIESAHAHHAIRVMSTETRCRTLVERPPEAADYPDADPLLLVAGSAVFRPTPHPVPLYSAECVGQSDTTDDASPRRVFATVEEAVEAATTLRSGNT